MELTRIEEENREAFEAFFPEDIFEEDDQALGVLSEDGKPVAAAVFSPGEQGVMLKWIFTDPEERRKGAATLLLHDAMFYLAGEVPALTASWPEEMEGIGELLHHLGFTITEGEPVYSIPAFRLLKNPEIQRISRQSFPGRLICLSEASEKTRNALAFFLKKEAGGDHYMKRIDPALSFVTEDEERQILGCLLTSSEGETWQIELLLNTEKGDLDQLMSGLAQKGMSQAPSTELRFVAASPEIAQFADRLIGQKAQRSFQTKLKYAVMVLER